MDGKNIDLDKTNYLLSCDYAHLCTLVASATIETPAVATVLLERDLSYLLRHVKQKRKNNHMDASIRMTCAFLELGDPFPYYSYVDKKGNLG